MRHGKYIGGPKSKANPALPEDMAAADDCCCVRSAEESVASLLDAHHAHRTNAARRTARALEMTKPRSIAAQLLAEEQADWEHATLLWRTLPAHRFHRGHLTAVTECMRRIETTFDVWRAATAGNAASAIRLALQMEIPSQVTIRTDLVMTVLLFNALRGNAAAKIVMSNLIRRMPLDPKNRRRFAASWLANSFHDAWPEADGRIGRAKAPSIVASRGGEDGA